MRAGRGLATAGMLVGFVASLVTSFELVSLFGDELDSAGYLLVGVAIHGVSVLLMFGFAIIVFGPPTPKVKSRSARVTGLAVIPVAFLIAATVYTVVQRPADDAARISYWVEPMLPATIIICAGIALIAVASTTSRTRVRGFATGGAALVLAAAAVVQPGALPSVAMSLGVLLAAVFLWRGELVQQGPRLPANKGVPAQ